MIDRNGAVCPPAIRACTGPLASHIGGFTALLNRRGYAPKTMQAKCMLVVDLSRWLEVRGLSLDRLDQARLRQFHQDHRDRKRRGDVATGEQLLGYLRDLGCIQAPPLEADLSPVGELIGEFARFLSSERGLSQATLINYLPIIRRFLAEQVPCGALHLDELRAADIHRFIVRHAQSGSRGGAKNLVTALRSFLRFLQQCGVIMADLAGAVPGVAGWRLSHLPKTCRQNRSSDYSTLCNRN